MGVRASKHVCLRFDERKKHIKIQASSIVLALSECYDMNAHSMNVQAFTVNFSQV